MKSHPMSQGWITLQTLRTPERQHIVCARYFDRHVILSFWTYDSVKQEQGAHVGWEMTNEIILQHHAVVTLNGVYADGMRDHLKSLSTCDRCQDSGVLKYVTEGQGGEPYAATFCDCPAGQVRRS